VGRRDRQTGAKHCKARRRRERDVNKNRATNHERVAECLSNEKRKFEATTERNVSTGKMFGSKKRIEGIKRGLFLMRTAFQIEWTDKCEKKSKIGKTNGKRKTKPQNREIRLKLRLKSVIREWKTNGREKAPECVWIEVREREKERGTKGGRNRNGRKRIESL
jgi:hypothetical protein